MWKTLVHNGPYVQPEYVKIKDVEPWYNGKRVVVPAIVQQYFFLYCKYKQPKDVTFSTNFFNSMNEVYPPVLLKEKFGQNPELFDFKEFTDYLENLGPPTPKDKAEALRIKEFHSICVLDDVPQVVGGYAVEPAALFKGLGDNPNRGKIKLAVRPQDITINTSVPPAKFPKPPYGTWKAIVHDTNALYTASFRSNVTGKIKYIYLNRNSDFKISSEIEKYEKARSLALVVDDIRKAYHKLLSSQERRDRELGLAVYLVDRYAFRVGNEPSTGSGAETTGATTLKKSNVTPKKGNLVHFNFVAKDSIVYDATLRMDLDALKVLKELLGGAHGGGQGFGGTRFPGDPVVESLFAGRAKPTKGAPPPGDASLFTKVTSTTVNKWLEDQLEGLTAKVFRTYNASILIQRELLNKNLSNFSDDKKLAEFTRVNTEIAIVCNHRTAVNPEKRQKIDDAIAEIEALEAPTAKQVAKKEKLLRDKMTLGVSLTTSKMNYIDPRLVYAWCEKNEIKPSAIYSKSLLEATAWANTEEHMSAFYV